VSFRQEQGAANATINRELEGLQRAFSLAKNKLAFAPTFPNLPEDNVREGFFDKADFFAVMQHLKDSDVRDFCEWGFWTGMRKGEIAALTWAAFNRESCTITLPGRSAKNRKPRTVPVRGDLEPILQRRLAARRLDCPLIFHRAGQPVGGFPQGLEKGLSGSRHRKAHFPRSAQDSGPEYGSGWRRHSRGDADLRTQNA
jgi:integrase